MLIEHEKQRELWDQEHKNPFVLKQMDNQNPSSSVKSFFNWLSEEGFLEASLSGVEMGCGKGRNSIWLAEQGVKMEGFDFSRNAIEEAKKRSVCVEEVDFLVHDATQQWPYQNDQFDFGIDCFASTDIESSSGRLFAKEQFKRVLKPGGLLLVYTLSTDDQFHKEMLKQSPGSERNSFLHPTTGKFEKVFDEDELRHFYEDFEWLSEKRVKTVASFFGKKYPCSHFWLVLKNS